MKTDELREKYLAFFESKGCTRRPSDVLVPRWDPSVLFTPAGMNQFKDHFLGRCKLDFTRATTCQKCLRTGDIDNVGRTAYHHTFFEMLGNFSFGDYFKRDAIRWAWEFLTHKKWLHLPPEKLSATIYLDDDEAADIWLDEVKLPPERLQRLGEDENFWPANAPSQGPDGVCGPCSEIYFQTPFGQVEIWNLVFTQFNRVGDPPNNLRPLPSKNIDTGMGLERTAAVLQGVETNFHIDILRPLVETAGEVCGVRYDPADENGRRLRRIADHLRACAFAVHENVYPGNKKQGYVIRRLLRRAVLDGHQMGVREPFLHKLVGKVAELMQNPYPELSETVPAVAGVIEKEEANFLATLDTGLDRIERIFAEMKSQHRGIVSAAEAADMFQTHGFPPELFETLAAERNLAFDWKGFREEMEKHGIESGGGQKVELFRHDPLEGLKKALHGSHFLGYEALEVNDAKVVGIIANDQLCDQIDEVDHEQPIVVVLDKTPFYGEMGGQVGDHGEIVAPGFHFEVIDSQIDGGFTLHRGHLREGRIELGATATARVDLERRQGISRAHTATHLLHHALQKHLGSHALQQGSKVDYDWLRFDFANPSAVSEEQLIQIENEVNGKILAGEPVGHVEMPLTEARKTGATMLFGEKYCDVVPRRLGRRLQQGALRRHASGQQRAGRHFQDHRRRERGGGHAADYRNHRAGSDGPNPPRPDDAPSCGELAQSTPRRIARPHRKPGQGAAATEEASGGRTEKRAIGRSDDRRRGRRRRREGGDRRSARRPERIAADDRPASTQGRAGGRAAGQSAGRGEEGDADRRFEPRSGRARSRRGGVGESGLRGGGRRRRRPARHGPSWRQAAARTSRRLRGCSRWIKQKLEVSQ